MIEPAPSPPPPRNMVLDPPLAEAHYLEWWGGGACRVIEGASPNIEGLEPPNVPMEICVPECPPNPIEISGVAIDLSEGRRKCIA